MLARCLLVAEKKTTDVEKLNVVQDMVVIGEIIAWDDVDTGVFLNFPVGKTKSLSLSKKLPL